MGGGCDCRAVETRPAQNLFPMNAPERFKQDRVLTGERETTKEKQSAVTRRERQKRKNKTERKKNM